MSISSSKQPPEGEINITPRSPTGEEGVRRTSDVWRHNLHNDDLKFECRYCGAKFLRAHGTSAFGKHLAAVHQIRVLSNKRRPSPPTLLNGKKAKTEPEMDITDLIGDEDEEPYGSNSISLASFHNDNRADDGLDEMLMSVRAAMTNMEGIAHYFTRAKDQQHENARLRRRVAELELENATLRKKIIIGQQNYGEEPAPKVTIPKETKPSTPLLCVMEKQLEELSQSPSCSTVAETESTERHFFPLAYDLSAGEGWLDAVFPFRRFHMLQILEKTETVRLHCLDKANPIRWSRKKEMQKAAIEMVRMMVPSQILPVLNTTNDDILQAIGERDMINGGGRTPITIPPDLITQAADLFYETLRQAPSNSADEWKIRREIRTELARKLGSVRSPRTDKHHLKTYSDEIYNQNMGIFLLKHPEISDHLS
ncbi:unnamed protein product, partial [Mesorhabditis spiculigera]